MDQTGRRRRHTRAATSILELIAEEEREVNRLTVNSRLAAETRDLETYRINYDRLVRLFVGSYARWIRGRRRGAGAGFVL